MKSKGKPPLAMAAGIFGFYQWLNTTAPVPFKEDGVAMMDQMLGNFIPALVEVPMGPRRNMNIMPALKVTSARLPINGDFKTPLLNGALFHQSTFRDLFGIDGVSFTLAFD